MFLKRPFLNDTDEASALQFIVRVSCETELQAIVLDDRPLSQFDSFSGKMVLKRLLIGDTGKLVHLLSDLLGDRVSS